MAVTSPNEFLERFERREIDVQAFGHVEHVRAAHAMLGRYDFLEACHRYGGTIRSMAESVGALDKFSATITLAFMSVIAERMNASESANFDSFLENNPDLLDRNVLDNWYSSERLSSPTSRKQFLLPDRVAEESANA